jgi:hypothetical protein
MDHHQRRHSPRGNAPRRPGSGSGGASSPGRHKGGGGKKPIKVVYISNPMRVKTSAARFRALVQELTGRHADPSKYSPEDLADGGGAANIDGAAQGLSPGDADVASSDTAVVACPSAAADHQPDATGAAPHGGYCDEYDDDDDYGFRSRLLENNYAFFSPPMLLHDYDQHPHSTARCVCLDRSVPLPSPAACRLLLDACLPFCMTRSASLCIAYVPCVASKICAFVPVSQLLARILLLITTPIP